MPTEEPPSDASRAHSATTDPSAPPTRAPTGHTKLSSFRNNLAMSRAGSRMNLSEPRGAGGVPQSARTVADAPVNAVMFENTFKLKPDRKFQSETVRRIAAEILQRNLTKQKYESGKSPIFAQSISNEILGAVKKLDYERYKIMVDVTIGEFKGQGIQVASRAVWDTTTDSYASARRSRTYATIFAVAIVFGCYFE
ncbi:Tctex-1 family-domain-containing protein [Fimicolochytrium jonesii]|uniref:Tctex-1 family-domain-containing protein n=1 Tax=Fimicolochytrium jonesii TaxID=1396493 RepID=UPI0022FEEE29|nr:Tctex-1 family-domain-containing protein [Fimicolochytrium jonesii]KAI8826262.1 Tctex-1 family-domain-containing protein [Fimicolochytrium jonesii]